MPGADRRAHNPGSGDVIVAQTRLENNPTVKQLRSLHSHAIFDNLTTKKIQGEFWSILTNIDRSIRRSFSI